MALIEVHKAAQSGRYRAVKSQAANNRSSQASIQVQSLQGINDRPSADRTFVRLWSPGCPQFLWDCQGSRRFSAACDKQS